VQDLILTRCQPRVRLRLVRDTLELAEDTDHVPAALKRHSAQLRRKAFAVRVQEDASIVWAFAGAQKIPGEHLEAPPPLLGRQGECHVLAADVADETLGGGINPADDPVSIDDVGGNADALERALDISADLFETGQAAVCDRPVLLVNRRRDGAACSVDERAARGGAGAFEEAARRRLLEMSAVGIRCASSFTSTRTCPSARTRSRRSISRSAKQPVSRRTRWKPSLVGETQARPRCAEIAGSYS